MLQNCVQKLPQTLNLFKTLSCKIYMYRKSTDVVLVQTNYRCLQCSEKNIDPKVLECAMHIT